MILIALLLSLIYMTISIIATYVNEGPSVDDIKAMVPPPSPDAAETTVIKEVPPPPPEAEPTVIEVVVPPPPPPPPQYQIELYQHKNYKGTKKVIYPGMQTEFAKYQGERLSWTYQSMKIVPGTYLKFWAKVSGKLQVGFAVGKLDVPDMYEFIKSYENIYTCQGICMDRDYWNRPFYISVLKGKGQWDRDRAAKYSQCRDLWYVKKRPLANQIGYCKYAEPESNENVTA